MIEESIDKFLAPEEKEEDKGIDISLRPLYLKDYVGQEKIKQNLEIFIQAAKMRKEPIEHVLLHGAPGLGKTTLAHIIAKEMNVNVKVTSGPAIEKAGDLAAILTNIGNNDILFIDEIHRLNKTIEEILYPAMEDFCLDIIVGKGPSARTLRLELPHFTIIGATTRPSLLSAPLRDRFGNIYHLEYYTVDEIKKIINRNSKILNIDFSNDESLLEIAKRCRFTPRIANRLLKRVRDYALVKGNGIINLETSKNALQMLQIDDFGLDEVDRKILKIIIEKFSGGPVGLNTIAAASGEEIDTIAEIIEPFLIQSGFLMRTPKGRITTPLAQKHLHYE